MLPTDMSSFSRVPLSGSPWPNPGSHSELPQGRGGSIIVPETVLPGGLMSDSDSNIPAKMALEGDGRAEAEG